MNFKIDTKDFYTVISPNVPHLDENLTASIEKKWTELQPEGNNSLIIDLQDCKSCAENVMDEMARMHERFYTNEQSLVFTNMQPQVKKQLQQQKYYDTINVAPTLIEAVDIISMELLQRDLLGEDEAAE